MKWKVWNLFSIALPILTFVGVLYHIVHKIAHTVYLKRPFLSCTLSIQEGLFVGTT